MHRNASGFDLNYGLDFCAIHEEDSALLITPLGAWHLLTLSNVVEGFQCIFATFGSLLQTADGKVVVLPLQDNRGATNCEGTNSQGVHRNLA